MSPYASANAVTLTTPVAVPRPKQRHLPDDVGLRNSSCELTKYRLGDDKVDVVRQATVKPLSPVPGGIGMTKRRQDAVVEGPAIEWEAHMRASVV